jgi:DNA polymerase III epsilon subunit-like protein
MIFLDTETTGLEVKDRICALGIIEGESNHFELINPGKKIPPAASAIHQITNEMVSDAPSFSQSISAEKLKILNTPENILVSHNAPFELSMLQKEGVAGECYRYPQMLQIVDG